MPQVQTRNMEEVVGNPDFQKLSRSDQQRAVAILDPDYAKLKPAEQRAALDALIRRFAKQPEPDTFMAGLRSTLPKWADVKRVGKGLAGIPDEGAMERGEYAPGLTTTGFTLRDIAKGIYDLQEREFERAQALRPSDTEPYLKTLPRRIEGAGHLLASAVPVFGPMAASAGEDIGSGHFARGFGKATGTLGQVLAPRLVPKAGKAAGAVVRAGARAAGIAPEIEIIEGVPIPRLASEVRPGSVGGRIVAGTKRLGLNEPGFSRFSSAQNQAVKQVINRLAEKTASDNFSAILDNPSKALNMASDVTAQQASGMYRALDAAVDQIPGGGAVLVEEITPVMQKFLKRFPPTQVSLPGGDVLVDARGIAANMLKDAESATVSPFQTAQKMRTALYNAAERTTDSVMRRSIFEAADEVDSAMQSALERTGNTELSNLWREANRLWTKKYALNEVADAVSKSLKGAPAGIADSPPALQGGSLTQRLNRLAESPIRGRSVLERAFGTDATGQAHITAIRRAVSLLEQAQQVRIGNKAALTRMLFYAAPAGAAALSGHLGYAGYAVMGEIGAAGIARAMTTMKGARAVVKLLESPTRADAALAARMIQSVSGGSGSSIPGEPMSRTQLTREAVKLRSEGKTALADVLDREAKTTPIEKAKATVREIERKMNPLSLANHGLAKGAVILGDFTDEGFRSAFDIPSSMSLGELVDRGTLERTPSGLYRLKLTPAQEARYADAMKRRGTYIREEPRAGFGTAEVPVEEREKPMGKEYMARHQSSFDEAKAQWQREHPGEDPSRNASAILKLADEIERGRRGPKSGTPSTPRPSDTITVEVEGKQHTVQLNESQKAEWGEAKQQYESSVRHAETWRTTDPDRTNALRKGAAMRFSAEKRRITGLLTGREAQVKAAREASNYIGKSVTYKGQKATVVGHAFGRVRLRLESGEVVSAQPEDIEGGK